MVDKASCPPGSTFYHPEDSPEPEDEQDEESRYQQRRVEEQMRLPGGGAGGRLNLPPPSFDSGRTTGVKGVIADARSFEQARRQVGWRGVQSGEKSREAGRINGGEMGGREEEEEGLEEDDEFLERWREERRREIAREGNDIRNRRTSPSVRRYGRFDEVDALGYLDAIEKVRRETVVVVFVYDVEVCFLHHLPAQRLACTAMLTSPPSAPSARSSTQRSARSCPSTPPSTSSRCTTTKSSSTTRACRPSWRIGTRGISSQTSRISSIRYPRTRCSTRRR